MYQCSLQWCSKYHFLPQKSQVDTTDWDETCFSAHWISFCPSSEFQCMCFSLLQKKNTKPDNKAAVFQSPGLQLEIRFTALKSTPPALHFWITINEKSLETAWFPSRNKLTVKPFWCCNTSKNETLIRKTIKNQGSLQWAVWNVPHILAEEL